MSTPADTPPDADASWVRQAERSSVGTMRFMVWLSLSLGRRLSRIVLHGIATYFLFFAPAAGRASRGYLQRILGRRPTLAERYRHVMAFATTIHDRIYFLNGRFTLFDIDIAGAELIDAALADGRGLLLFGAHLGSFEVLRAVGRHHTEHPVCMLMHEENARKINSVLAAINPAASRDILPLGQLDSMLRRPVFFMSGVYLGGNKYRIRFAPIADFSAVERKERAAAIDAAQLAYAAMLEDNCRNAPYNWFNFFDFWRPPAVRPETHTP